MADRSFPILDQPDIAGVLFHPRPEFGGFGGGRGQSVSVAVAPDCRLGGRLNAADPGAPVVLYFHGNGEIAADYTDIATLYSGIGLTLLVVDFRGYGRSDGSPSAGTMIADAVATFDLMPEVLTETGTEAGSLYVMGRSLGSAAAVAVAQRAGAAIGGLILESGFSDTFGLIARIGGPSLEGVTEQRDGFDNAGILETLSVPTLVIHGREDRIIPVDDGRELHRRAGTLNKRMVEIPRAGHNDLLLVDPRTYFQAIRDLVDG